MAKALRNAGLTVVSLLVLLAATGWLYLIRPQVGTLGPSLPEALPLDELANKAGLPLLVFAGIWGCAALLLGLFEGYSLPLAATFFAQLFPGPVNQDTPHDLRGNAKEVRTILPVNIPLIDELQIGLVNECSRLQRMAFALVIHVAMSQTM